MNESSQFTRIRLTAEQRQDLYSVLADFFSNFNLEDIRKICWNWLVAAMSNDAGAYNSGQSRSNLIFVYEKLLLLLEATDELNKRRKKKQKWEKQRWAKN